MQPLYLITGANGHLGSALLRALSGTNCRVRALILPTETGKDTEQVTYYRGDVTKFDSLTDFFSGLEGQAPVVIHAAGVVSIASQVDRKLYDVNVNGTKNVLRQALRHKVKRLVYVSSVHAIPEPDAFSTIQEVSSFHPSLVRGAYAKTKAAASQAVLNAGQRGLDVVVIHPSGILGPYDHGNNHVVQMVQSYLAGRLPAGVTGGYDFVDVRDVAAGCLAAAERGTPGACYILSNRYCTVRELLDLLRHTAGGRWRPCLPLPLAKAAAPAFELAAALSHTRPLFTRYSLYTMGSNGRFTHDKATRELGYHPRDMKDTVADTVAWLQGVPLEAETCSVP